MAQVTTGEIRSALQAVRFMRLTEDLTEDLTAGTMVALQYWGNGQVRVTAVYTNATGMVVANRIRAEWLDRDGAMTEGDANNAMAFGRNESMHA